MFKETWMGHCLKFRGKKDITCNWGWEWHTVALYTGCPWKKGNPSFRVHYSIIKNDFFHKCTHHWKAHFLFFHMTICTWYGTLTFVQSKYAHVKNHNEPNVATIQLFWTIGFLSVPLQIVCNRSCVIHWSCLWCHMKEENMGFPMIFKNNS